jgi:hypothetical protein
MSNRAIPLQYANTTSGWMRSASCAIERAAPGDDSRMCVSGRLPGSDTAPVARLRRRAGTAVVTDREPRFERLDVRCILGVGKREEVDIRMLGKGSQQVVAADAIAAIRRVRQSVGERRDSHLADPIPNRRDCG